MNTDDMQAGRSLDAEVAERIMGWERRAITAPSWLAGYSLVCAPDQSKIHTEPCGPDIPLYPYSADEGKFPHYSTRIADAWLVVSQIEAQRGWWEMTKVGQYTVTFHVNGNRFEAAGDTVPLAICRAALKAVGA